MRSDYKSARTDIRNLEFEVVSDINQLDTVFGYFCVLSDLQSDR